MLLIVQSIPFIRASSMEHNVVCSIYFYLYKNFFQVLKSSRPFFLYTGGGGEVSSISYEINTTNYTTNYICGYCGCLQHCFPKKCSF